MKKITVKAPATVANLVCGFDVLGMCLEAPFDVMELKIIDKPGVAFTGENKYNLPTAAEKNTAGKALLSMMEAIDFKKGFELSIQKNIKPGSGIGSSAASAAGAVVAANFLLGEQFTRNELVNFAMAGEQVASGAWHADNIAPGIFGGVTLVRCIDPLDIITIPAQKFFVTIIHPQIEIKTSEARKILPEQIPLKAAVAGWANIAALVTGLIQNDTAIISRSMEDRIVEPVRKKLIPGFDEIKQKCLSNGAIGGGIAGSGPSVFMLSDSMITAELLQQQMEEVYDRLSIPYKTYVTKIASEGVSVIE